MNRDVLTQCQRKRMWQECTSSHFDSSTYICTRNTHFWYWMCIWMAEMIHLVWCVYRVMRWIAWCDGYMVWWDDILYLVWFVDGVMRWFAWCDVYMEWRDVLPGAMCTWCDEMIYLVWFVDGVMRWFAWYDVYEWWDHLPAVMCMSDEMTHPVWCVYGVMR